MYIKHGFTEFLIPSKPISHDVKLTCDNEKTCIPNNCRSLKLINIKLHIFVRR